MIEVQVINYLLTTKNEDFLNQLEKEYFTDMRREYLVIRNHYEKYSTIPDKETFISIVGDWEYFEVKEAPSYLLEELINFTKRKLMAENYNQVGKYLVEGNVEKAESDLRKINQKLDEFTNVLDLPNMFNDNSRLEKFWEIHANADKIYPKTGFAALDDEDVLGGIQPNTLGIVYGRPGEGKSYFSLKMASELAYQGKRVAYFASEMSRIDCQFLIDTMRYGIPVKCLRRGKATESYVDRSKHTRNVGDNYEYLLKRDAESNKNLCLMIFDRQDLKNVPMTVSLIKKIVKKYKIEYFFIDQVQHMKDEKFSRTEFDRVGHIIDDLMLLPSELNVSIIGVVQQNRTKNESDDKDTTQIAFSDKIAQNAHWCLNIHQIPTDKELSEKIVYLELTKNRFGNKGKFPYVVNFSTGTFEYKPDYDPKKKIEKDEGKEIF